MAEEETNIFIDKIKLSFVVLEKESVLIETYSKLIKRINGGYVKLKNVEMAEEYDGSWNFIYELYNFLRFNKIKDIKKKHKKEGDIQKKIVVLHETMGRYENAEKKVNFKDLQIITPIILQFISLSGYHDDKYQKDKGSLEDEEY